ncbi:ABC transporter permease [Halomonas sp. FeN2]|uniref:ABC transporter permease n=1 Tax=Halomonas sp. FeN2 TaxID=2832500 RepID=UPI000C6811ED|nr:MULTISPECIES: ABC transporter permease [unclassified Halomonas]MBF59030.1 sugar ABC transporter permease [Halomonas sp.]UBR49318.1 ABC transporter permease [Halomonas sp. FeN2]|tara:strand:+ start:3953 stop:4783 length:831 start_codon:yes stop_codon:yes gene_type:complete
MNPHALNTVAPRAMVVHLWRYRELIARLIKRDVLGRYKGSLLGLAWSFVTPIIMLVIYTFVFTVVFNARWGVGGEESKGVFALQLFAGLIVHGILAEVLTRSPSLILTNTNYVKKVVFPLEILPLVPLGSALFHAAVSSLVLILAQLVVLGSVPWTFWMLPLVLLPLMVLTMGISWLLASLGVFLRDIGQTMGLIATMLLFLSPIFYPISALPETFHGVIHANPLTFIIEQARIVLLEGQLPNISGLLKYLAVSLVVAWLGFAWFQKTRKGFADVL